MDYTLNTRELKDFISDHQLKDKYGGIHFEARVTITTSNNQIQDQCIARIAFDGYDNAGTLTLEMDDVDPNKFPTVFDAKYQIFKFDKSDTLTVNGIHTKNPIIGEYKVLISPV